MLNYLFLTRTIANYDLTYRTEVHEKCDIVFVPTIEFTADELITQYINGVKIGSTCGWFGKFSCALVIGA